MTATDKIIDSIEDRLRRLNEEIRTLTAARGALDGYEAQAGRRRQGRTTRGNLRSEHRPGAAAAHSADDTVAETSSEIPAPASAKARVRARSSRAGRRGSVGVVAAGQLEALLSQDGGMTASALAERADANRERVLSALRELEGAGRVRRSGRRRSTRWHAITDEERIQTRAAELAARSKPRG